MAKAKKLRIHVPAYSYLRHVAGRTRRVRVHVPAYEYIREAVEETHETEETPRRRRRPAKRKTQRRVVRRGRRPAAKSGLGPKRPKRIKPIRRRKAAARRGARRPRYEKFVPSRPKRPARPSRRAPKKRAARGPKPPKLTADQERQKLLEDLSKKRKSPPFPPDLRGTWKSAPAYEQEVYEACEEAGFPLVNADGHIENREQASESVHVETLFVWHERKLPPRESPVPQERYRVVRVWALVVNLKQEVSLLWTRSGSLPRLMTWDALMFAAQDILALIRQQIEEIPYLVFRGLVAWTGYRGHERALGRTCEKVGGTPPEDEE